MLVSVIGCAFVVAAYLACCAVYYDPKKGHAAGKTRRIAATSRFRLVARYLQLSLLVIPIAAFTRGHPLLAKLHDGHLALFLAGLGVSTVGLAVLALGKRSLGAQYSPCVDSYVPNAVVRHGIYAYIRHPIYTGNLTLQFGLFLATGSAWMLANTLLLAAYYLPTVLREEAALVESFPEYDEYRKRTARFIPCVF